MNERIVVEHATKVQVANLAQSRTLKVTKPQGDQSIVLDLSDRNATFDLSAVADEKMTLVKVGPKLIILFDNQSTVTADPFFDFSGKPLANLDVELGPVAPSMASNSRSFFQLPRTSRFCARPASFRRVVPIFMMPQLMLCLRRVRWHCFRRKGWLLARVTRTTGYPGTVYGGLSKADCNGPIARRSQRPRCSRRGFWPRAGPASPRARIRDSPPSRPRRRPA